MSGLEPRRSEEVEEKGGEEKWVRTWSPVMVVPSAGEVRKSLRADMRDGVVGGAGDDEEEEEEDGEGAIDAKDRACEDHADDEVAAVDAEARRLEEPMPAFLLDRSPRESSRSGAWTRRPAIVLCGGG